MTSMKGALPRAHTSPGQPGSPNDEMEPKESLPAPACLSCQPPREEGLRRGGFQEEERSGGTVAHQVTTVTAPLPRRPQDTNVGPHHRNA